MCKFSIYFPNCYTRPEKIEARKSPAISPPAPATFNHVLGSISDYAKATLKTSKFSILSLLFEARELSSGLKVLKGGGHACGFDGIFNEQLLHLSPRVQNWFLKLLLTA